MKKLLWAVVGVLMTMGLTACAEKSSPPGDTKALPDKPQAGTYATITPAEAKAMMEAQEDYVLLDVRTDAEYAQKHIDGAMLIPDFEITDRAETELPEKDQTILVYCRSGRRSASTAKVLVQMGYTSVYDFGGIIDWPYDTVSE